MFLLFSIVNLYSSFIFAESSTKVRIGHLQTQQIILQNKKIKHKNVFAVSYQNPNGFVFYRAIDKVTYKNIASDLNGLKNKILLQNGPLGLVACSNLAEVLVNNKNQNLCFDRIDKVSQKSFNKWFIKTSKLAQGELPAN